MSSSSTTTSSPTRTSYTSWSDTPPPECRTPKETLTMDIHCGGHYAVSRGGCPSGYWSACGSEGDTASPVFSTLATTNGKKTSLTSVRYMESHSVVICCPGALPWSCSTDRPRPTETNCILTTKAGYLAFNPAETQLSPIYAYGVTVSLAVRDAVAYTSISPEYKTTYIGEGKPTTVWCDNEYCMGAFDTPMTSTYSYPYATATSGETATSAGPSVPQPPEKMGQLGPLAIVAITGLAGALLLTLALLSPFMGEYRRRKKGQSPPGEVNTQ
ncbi:hypothetical protein BDP55DRAFT_634169 [Colletotrichum godetiae]|uniref:Uncharacterized protein n=1 Tax=Colletotrichum godetiae TaxID=1209918 RepID=A0AAJ0ETD5_9PEZI|nr:uncharacterized protein BDP55DRAFT_634169 [Colletotrichum godetiae]KAK1673223.1 hypothetical protein BDP55DRAFT_634169 [Colletotrichum godetiae]